MVGWWDCGDVPTKMGTSLSPTKCETAKTVIWPIKFQNFTTVKDPPKPVNWDFATRVGTIDHLVLPRMQHPCLSGMAKSQDVFFAQLPSLVDDF